MQPLKDAVVRDGAGVGNEIVKVDCILTAEASSIATALTTAQALAVFQWCSQEG